jgi:hypothetical protein
MRTLACAAPQNLADPAPEHVYDVLGRDKVRILRYGLFFLSGRAAAANDDADLAETGSLRDGEVRGKFIPRLSQSDPRPRVRSPVTGGWDTNEENRRLAAVSSAGG